ncbi:SRPBCC domain-containing protein [Actinoplanes sp. CA-030573]|uniref:SRPBCC domain-containing protein n=1 Tax=Actinoplanes sp. CA-030573 TaxID=3239898 RepID=UPI003D92EED9
MTGSRQQDPQALGSLRAADGKGIVRIERRLGAGVDELWAALTEPGRLASWLGEVDGDLRPGGGYRSRFFSSGAEATGRVAACDPPRRFRVVAKGAHAAHEQVIDVSLTGDEGGTVLVVEQRGLPLEWLAVFAAGLQIHIEDLAAYLAGGGRCDADARMGELVPAYESVPVTG